MNTEQTYLRITGWLTVLAGVLATACLVVGALAVEYDFDAFADPIRTLTHARNHALAYWFNILDLFGYYLLLLPVTLQLHQQLRPRSPWVPLITVSGAAYAVIGASGAAVLAAVWPALMQSHLSASPAEQATIALVFRATTLAVTTGLWNILEMVFAATWWIGVGLLLRGASPRLGWLTLASGVACLMDVVGNLGGLEALSMVGMNAYLVLSILWFVIGRSPRARRAVVSLVHRDRGASGARVTMGTARTSGARLRSIGESGQRTTTGVAAATGRCPSMPLGVPTGPPRRRTRPVQDRSPRWSSETRACPACPSQSAW